MGREKKHRKNAGNESGENAIPLERRVLPRTHKNYIILSALFILGLSLKIFERGRKPLWIDEALSY